MPGSGVGARGCEAVRQLPKGVWWRGRPGEPRQFGAELLVVVSGGLVKAAPGQLWAARAVNESRTPRTPRTAALVNAIDRAADVHDLAFAHAPCAHHAPAISGDGGLRP